jgi:Na+-transporting NADH:ubiquinone oxidoreductase subunit B
MDMFYGFIPGSTGETSVIAILIGALLLVWTGVASWKIMVSSVAGGLLVGWLGQLAGATALPCYYQLVMGGFLFGSVFMATDPVTAAQTETGKWIYGFLVGALAVVVRLWNPGYMEGMMLAILFMNTMAPLIDHCVVSVHTGRRAKKALTA